MKKILLLILLITSIGCAQQQQRKKDIIPLDGTSRDTLTIGRKKSMAMALDSASVRKLVPGSLAIWDTAKKAFTVSDTLDYVAEKLLLHDMTLEETYSLSLQNKDSILTKVSKTVYTQEKALSDENIGNIRDTLSLVESQVLLLAGEIELKVDSVDFTGTHIVSLINIVPDSIKIQSKNIELTGTAIFKALNSGGDSTTIEGAKITSSTFTTGTELGSHGDAYQVDMNSSGLSVEHNISENNAFVVNIAAGGISVDRQISGDYTGVRIEYTGITIDGSPVLTTASDDWIILGESIGDHINNSDLHFTAGEKEMLHKYIETESPPSIDRLGDFWFRPSVNKVMIATSNGWIQLN